MGSWLLMQMDFSNIKINYPQTRDSLRESNGYKALAGWARYNEYNDIVLGWMFLGPDDYVEPFSVSEIITHETIHHVVAKLTDQHSADSLDAMWQRRDSLDSGRVYIMHRVLKDAGI